MSRSIPVESNVPPIPWLVLEVDVHADEKAKKLIPNTAIPLVALLRRFLPKDIITEKV